LRGRIKYANFLDKVDDRHEYLKVRRFFNGVMNDVAGVRWISGEQRKIVKGNIDLLLQYIDKKGTGGIPVIFDEDEENEEDDEVAEDDVQDANPRIGSLMLSDNDFCDQCVKENSFPNRKSFSRGDNICFCLKKAEKKAIKGKILGINDMDFYVDVYGRTFYSFELLYRARVL
jgi:hypothetical protein